MFVYVEKQNAAKWPLGHTDLEVALWMLFGEHPVSCFDIFLVAPIKLSQFLQEMKRGLMDLSWDRMIKAHRVKREGENTSHAISHLLGTLRGLLCAV